MLRQFSALLRAAELTYALANVHAPSRGNATSALDLPPFTELLLARHTLGLIQHHDSLAATMATQWSQPSKYGPYDNVLADYESRIAASWKRADAVLLGSVQSLVR